MGCNPEIREDRYLFFEDIDNYITKAQNAESSDTSFDESGNCKSFYKTWESNLKNREYEKRICGQFLTLYNSLTSLNESSQGNSNYKKTCSFLNYWVNYHITRNFESICVKKIYNGLESSVYYDLKFYLLSNTIYDIDKDELYKINKLYNLYKNYNKLNTIIESRKEKDKQQLLTLSTQCCTDYNDVSYICNGDNKINNHKFCEKLTAFETKYKDLYPKVDVKGSDFNDNFIKLSECPNTKIISTAVTGSIIGLIPLFGVLYKFTPMGQVLRSKIGMLNKDTSNNDEELTKMSLMEQENEPLRFKQGTYNIKYQSL